MADTVLVVEFRLGDRVIDVNGGEEKLALFEELVQAVNTGGGLFGHTLDSCSNLGELSGAFGEVLPKNLQNDLPLGRVTSFRLRNNASLFEFNTLVDEKGGIATVVKNHVGTRVTVSTPVKNLLSAPPVLLQCFALPGKDCGSLGVLRSSTTDDDGCCRVILGGENVAASPAHIST